MTTQKKRSLASHAVEFMRGLAKWLARSSLAVGFYADALEEIDTAEGMALEHAKARLEASNRSEVVVIVAQSIEAVDSFRCGCAGCVAVAANECSAAACMPSPGSRSLDAIATLRLGA